MAIHGAFRLLAGRTADANGVIGQNALTVENGRIVRAEPWNATTRPQPGDIDARHLTLVPGFIDIHVHGGVGLYLMDGTTDTLRTVAAHLARHGVTGFLSTTITGPWEQQAATLHTAAQAMQSPENGREGAAVLGCHLEGPYINPAKKGAQPEQFIRIPDVNDLVAHCGDDLHAVKVITLAPEMNGALALIRFLHENRIIASIGHTNATYAEAIAAIEAGARHVTHCYNAMSALTSREPGVVGAAFAHSKLTAELIWDNHHVHPAACEALIWAKGAEGVILISDGIPGTGMGDGYRFSLGDLPVTVQNGTARLPDGTLAGSLLTLDRAFAHASAWPLPQRTQMASRNAAVALGLEEHKGLLMPGYDADFVLLNPAGEVERTFIAGRCVYSSED